MEHDHWDVKMGPRPGDFRPPDLSGLGPLPEPRPFNQSRQEGIEALRAECERLRRERDEYASVALAGLSGLVCTPEKGYIRDGGPGLLRDDFRRLRKVHEEAIGDRDSCVGSYKAYRKVLADAGIPCQFGRGGEPTTEAGFPRDLADCLGTLVERIKAAEVERDNLLAVCLRMAAAVREQVIAGGGDYSESAARADLAVLEGAIAKAEGRS